MNKILQQVVGELAERRAQIIDDFCKTYISARYDWFMAKPSRLTRLELVEKVMPDGIDRTYSFKVKSGRAKEDK